MTAFTEAIQAQADADHARQGVCSWCGRLGEPYEHNGVRFDGLTACQGDRLCALCRERYVAGTPLLVEVVYQVNGDGTRRSSVYDLNRETQTEETAPPVQCIAVAYRAEYSDIRLPPRRRRG